MGRKVLIVEDEMIVADDLDWQLTKMGFEVIGVAASADEALAAVEDRRPEIVLMDIQLQGRMSGIEAAKSIQQQSGAAIIFITAFPAVLVRNPEQMLPPGICLSKPISIVQLRAALESVATAPSSRPISKQ